MARISVESAKTVINSLLSEQDRDREYLQRMMTHSEKMTEHLTRMREEEELRIDTEAAERKAASARLFGQLLAVEEERRQRLSQHMADLEGMETSHAKLEAGNGDPFVGPRLLQGKN